MKHELSQAEREVCTVSGEASYFSCIKAPDRETAVQARQAVVLPFEMMQCADRVSHGLSESGRIHYIRDSDNDADSDEDPDDDLDI